MTVVSNDGRFFQLKLFIRLSIKSFTIYRPNESKIYVYNGNGKNSILVNDGLTYYGTGVPNVNILFLLTIITLIWFLSIVLFLMVYKITIM